MQNIYELTFRIQILCKQDISGSQISVDNV